jgi:hypothetical protein
MRGEFTVDVALLLIVALVMLVALAVIDGSVAVWQELQHRWRRAAHARRTWPPTETGVAFQMLEAPIDLQVIRALRGPAPTPRRARQEATDGRHEEAESPGRHAAERSRTEAASGGVGRHGARAATGAAGAAANDGGVVFGDGRRARRPLKRRRADCVNSRPGHSSGAKMQTHSLTSPIPRHPIPSTFTVQARARTSLVLDPVRAIDALGAIAFAAERRALSDVLDAWRTYCHAVGRPDLMLAAPRAFPMGIPLPIDSADGWTYLTDVAFATARNMRAGDAERHWQYAASTFAQAAANAASYRGARVADSLRHWRAVGWSDEDEETGLLNSFDEDGIVALAATAAHYGRIALGSIEREPNDPIVRDTTARAALDREVRTALLDAGVLERRNSPTSIADDDVLDVCRICQGVDTHERECPLTALDATHLLHVYRVAFDDGGAR